MIEFYYSEMFIISFYAPVGLKVKHISWNYSVIQSKTHSIKNRMPHI
jgi:hypothetical protein